MENLSNRDINTLRHTKFPVLVGRNFNGVVWEVSKRELIGLRTLLTLDSYGPHRA
jgi:hypothetical protein